MILVYDMKVIETHDKDYYHQIEHIQQFPVLGYYDNPESNVSCEVTTETIKGERFRNNMGLDVIIGWDKQTQKCLGLPFKVFHSMDRRRQSDYEENTRLRKKLREWGDMTLWQFIKRKVYKG